MKMLVFFFLLVLVSGTAWAKDITVHCYPMTQKTSKSLNFGYPNEFWECDNGGWSLTEPENVTYKIKVKK